MEKGDKVKIVDYGDGSLNGEEVEITEIADSEDLKYRYEAQVWRPSENLKIVKGVIYTKSIILLRDGEFEPVKKEE